MADPDVGTFTVTPEELSGLASRVWSVQYRLNHTRDLVDDISAALGSHTVASALGHFVSGWRDGRKEITTEVNALSAMLSQAAQAYTDTDTSLAAAIPS